MSLFKRKQIRLRARAQWSIYEQKESRTKTKVEKDSRRIRQVHSVYPRRISELFENLRRQQASLDH